MVSSLVAGNRRNLLIGFALAIPLVGLCAFTEGEKDGLLRAATWILMVIALSLPEGRWRNILGFTALTYGVWSVFMIVRTNFLFLHEWDFYCIYLDSKAASMGLNPIRPENYPAALAAMDAPIAHSDVFREEILDVGMKYFPSALWSFAPFGFLSYQQAHVAWVLLNWAAFLGGMKLLHQQLAQDLQPKLTLPLLVGLVLLWPATKPVVHFENSHMLCFLMVMLLWRDRDKPIGALWIVMGSVCKPFFLLLTGYFVVRRNWKAVGLTLAGIALSWAMVIPIWGIEPIQDFFFNNPNGRVPSFQFTSKINHSLLSVLVRAVEFDFSQGYLPTRMPIFLATGGLISMLTVGVCWLTPQAKSEWHLAAILGLAVLMYPGSLKPYSLFLLPLFLLHWKSPFLRMTSIWILLSGFVMFFMIRYAFWTNLWLWGVSVLYLIHKIRGMDKPWKNVLTVSQTSNFF